MSSEKNWNTTQSAPNWLPSTIVRWLDDLRWVCARLLEKDTSFYDWDEIEEMLAEYTEHTLTYSDGSSVGTEYLPNCFQAFKPPHRRFGIHKTGETDN